MKKTRNVKIKFEKSGGEVAGFNFLVGLDFLNGEEKLKKFSHNISTFVKY